MGAQYERRSCFYCISVPAKGQDAGGVSPQIPLPGKTAEDADRADFTRTEWANLLLNRFYRQS